MFIGEYQHSIDDKGRVIMPSKFREDLGDKFFITKGMDNCLFVFPQEEWDRIDEKITALQLADKRARGLSRLFYSGAIDGSLDKQGRTLLPNNLREYAGITKDVVIIGVSKRVEIWDKEKWEEYNNNDTFNYDTLTETMIGLDF